MAIVRGRRPNLAEMAIYRPFLDRFDLTFFYSGLDSGKCRAQLDEFGLGAMRAARYTSISDLIPYESMRRVMEYKVGIGSYMLSHVKDVLSHDYVNIVDPIYAFAHQIVKRIRPSQKLIIVRWENMHGRYGRVWLASARVSRIFQRANVVLCVSRAAVSTLRLPGDFSGRVVHVYPGIDLGAVSSNGSITPRRLRPFFENGRRPTILFVARLQWTKGLQVLLVALHILRRQMRLCADVWVIGSGGEAPFRSLVEELGLQEQVQFLGLLSNSAVCHKMAEADLFCFPSLLSQNWMEQFGFAVVEAMAHGLPVVAFDSGSIREICGEDAVYASAGNAHSLAEAIARILENKPEALARGERLRRRAFCEFNADVQGGKMLEAIL